MPTSGAKNLPLQIINIPKLFTRFTTVYLMIVKIIQTLFFKQTHQTTQILNEILYIDEMS